MADAGSGDEGEIQEVDPSRITAIRCGMCERWNRNRLEARGGVFRCHFCGFVLWALTSVLERVDGQMSRLYH